MRAARGGGLVPRRGRASSQRHVRIARRRARGIPVRVLDRGHLPAHRRAARRHSSRRRAPLRATPLRHRLRPRLQRRRTSSAHFSCYRSAADVFTLSIDEHTLYIVQWCFLSSGAFRLPPRLLPSYFSNVILLVLKLIHFC